MLPKADSMNDKTVGGVHWSFWVIGAVALVWNVLGGINFFAQMNPDVLDAYRESERAIVEGRPVWATGAFAIAVFGGALGSLLLLLRKSAAFYVFVVSLLGAIVTMTHTLGVDIDFAVGEFFGIIVLPLVVAGFLIWYSKWTEIKGWIRTEMKPTAEKATGGL